MIMWFGIIWSLSMLTRYVYIYRSSSRGLINVLSIIGVIIHEVGHALMCIIFGVKMTSFSVKFRSEYTGELDPHGSVGLHNVRRAAFLQVLMISLGPVIFSTWVFLLCFDLLVFQGVEFIVGVILIIIMISTVVGASPSRPDMKLISQSYDIDPLYSLYQIGLVAIAFSILYFFIDLSALALPMELLYYIFAFFLLVVIYYGLKYTILSIKYLFSRIFRSSNVNFKKMTRKRHKPYKPKRTGIEDEL